VLQPVNVHYLSAVSMKTSRLYRTSIVAISLCIAAVAMLTIRTFQFDPDPNGDGDFMARAQQKSVAGIKVSASALGAEESRRSFGENLSKYDIQPVWLSIGKRDRRSTAEIDFIANNPGPTFFHCHHQDHMDEGFAGLIVYA
jgi:FtsP/CotA-like multicopper oxidase with cupredoxin domain